MTQQVLDRPTIQPPTDPATYRRLTAMDRCDGTTLTLIDGVKARGTCGAQAFVRVVLASGLDLLFCGHCAGELTQGKTVGRGGAAAQSRRATLEAQGAVFFSDYDQINLTPTDTSDRVRDTP